MEANNSNNNYLQYKNSLNVFLYKYCFFIETEIITTENVIIPTQGFNTGNKNELLIGFMLNQEKLKILN